MIIFSYILYISKYYLYEDYSKTEIPQMQRQKRVGVKLKFVYMKVILEIFLNLQFLQNN